MPTSKLFWVAMAVFQVVFGLLIFFGARSFYMNRPVAVVESDPVAAGPPLGEASALDVNANMLRSFMELETGTTDPAAVSLLADEYFEAGEYGDAAAMYEKLLAFDTKNVDVLNNLGLTLHYLGRSTEALARLEEGISADATQQRIWLTYGFVNSEVGNAARAREALTKAVNMNADNPVGQSAAKLLESLDP